MSDERDILNRKWRACENNLIFAVDDDGGLFYDDDSPFVVCEIYGKESIIESIVELHNAAMALRWTHDNALAECPCCKSLDVGAAGSIAHCYKCGLKVKGNNHHDTLNRWNTRGGILQAPPERE